MDAEKLNPMPKYFGFHHLPPVLSLEREYEREREREKERERERERENEKDREEDKRDDGKIEKQRNKNGPRMPMRVRPFLIDLGITATMINSRVSLGEKQFMFIHEAKFENDIKFELEH